MTSIVDASFQGEISPTNPIRQATKEQINLAAGRLQALKAQGKNEANSNEVLQLVSYLKSQAYWRNATPQGKPMNGTDAPMTNGSTSKESSDSSLQNIPCLSESENALFKVQVYALRMLSKNQPIPPAFAEAVVDPEAALRLSKGMNAQPKEPEVYTNEPEDTSSLVYPYNAYSTPSTSTSEYSIVPSLLPAGLDPHTFQEERNRIVQARIAQRIRELEEFPATLPDDAEDGASLKLRALVELKSLNLLTKQKQAREDLLRSMGQATALSLVSDRTAFKTLRKPTLKDSRSVENIERRQKADREKQAKQKHLDRLQAVMAHGSMLVETQKTQRLLAGRMGRNVMRFHSDTEKAEKARVERVSKERLKALRADDEEAYIKLIDTAKDTRITHLLRQTDSFLEGLSNSVRAQQNEGGKVLVDKTMTEAGSVDESAFGAAPMFEETEEKSKNDYYNVAHRIKEEVTKQPDIMVGGTLKPYQIKGLQWMISLFNNKLNGILADEMGLGKTIQTISLVTYLIEVKRIRSPYLIIVPLSTIPNWIAEFAHWAPTVKLMVYKGPPAARKTLADQLRANDFQVCLTTYEFIVKDRPVLARPRWVHMIIDEGHRLKNTQSRLSQTLQQYYSTRYRIILTGTPLQNNLPELWALLNFVLPKVFNSVQSFDEWFNTPFANTGGQDKIALNEEEQLLVIRRLHKVLRPFLLRRLKKDVEADLPDKVERIIKCKMSALQIKLYNQMKEHGVLVVEDQSGKSKQAGLKGLQNTIMQLRKICNHPFVYKAVEDSVKRPFQNEELLYRTAGKFELLDRILPKLFAGGHRVLMFFQMTQIMDIMQDYLQYRNTPNLRLDGATGQDIRGDIMRQFNAPDCKINIFLLSTRAGGLGLNLQTADTVILYDSDWNPHQDLQAQDRAHRIGQKKEVRIFRLVTSSSIEEHIVATAALKKDMDNKVIQGGKFDDKSTNAEREEHLRAILEANVEEEDIEGDYTDADLNEILARGDGEFEQFQEFDARRRQRDEEAWRARGNFGPMPERLIQLKELPPVYQIEPVYDIPEEELHDADGIRKRRQAAINTVAYDDGLSEDQFLRAVEGEDGQNLQDAMAANLEQKARRKLAQSNGGAGSPASTASRFDSEDLSDSGRPQVVEKRKRGRPSTASVTPSIINGDDEPRKRRKMAANKNDEMKPLYKKVIDAVKEVVSPDGYDSCSLFLDLPSKRDYADYYLVIAEPISLKQIVQKINKSAYASPAILRRDFQLMVQNAETYNDDGSVVVRDAHDLLNEFNKQMSALVDGVAPARKVPDSDEEAPATKVTLKINRGAVPEEIESD